MSKVQVPTPPKIPASKAPSVTRSAMPAPGAPEVSIGGTPGPGPGPASVPAATLKASSVGEAAVAAAIPALVPFAINAVSDARQASKDREAYRQHLIARLKSGSVLVPLKKQLGSYAEGLLEDTTEQLNRAVREPTEQPPPFSSIPPVRNPL